jgi:uncharacterized protein (DUF488 family)
MGVAICLYPPIDWAGLRFPTLAPPNHLFFAKKAGKVDNLAYERIYYEQVLDKLDPQYIYDMFKNNVLLCWEEPGEFCHRRIVAKWIQDKLGIEVPEWNIKDEKIEELSKKKNIKPLF